MDACASQLCGTYAAMHARPQAKSKQTRPNMQRIAEMRCCEPSALRCESSAPPTATPFFYISTLLIAGADCADCANSAPMAS